LNYKTKNTFDLKICRWKQKQEIDVEFVSNVYIVDENKVILCHIRDISDRKKVDLH
jgi:hypothetical protein